MGKLGRKIVAIIAPIIAILAILPVIGMLCDYNSEHILNQQTLETSNKICTDFNNYASEILNSIWKLN